MTKNAVQGSAPLMKLHVTSLSPLPEFNTDIVLPTFHLADNQVVIPSRKPLIKKSICDSNPKITIHTSPARSLTFPCSKMLDASHVTIPNSAPVSPELKNFNPVDTYKTSYSQNDLSLINIDRTQHIGSQPVMSVVSDTESDSNVAEKDKSSEQSSDLVMPSDMTSQSINQEDDSYLREINSHHGSNSSINVLEREQRPSLINRAEQSMGPASDKDHLAFMIEGESNHFKDTKYQHSEDVEQEGSGDKNDHNQAHRKPANER